MLLRLFPRALSPRPISRKIRKPDSELSSFETKRIQRTLLKTNTHSVFENDNLFFSENSIIKWKTNNNSTNILTIFRLLELKSDFTLTLGYILTQL